MKLEDSIYFKTVSVTENADFDKVETVTWSDVMKCIVMPNSRASKVRGNDGQDYIYSYEILMRKPSITYPKENDEIRIVKKDGSVDKTLRVQGFVLLKNMWLKLWV